jgi:hypothetical protein
MNELPDTADGLQNKEADGKIPLGWWALFWGLIVWGVYYAWTYTPSLGGWSQTKAYDESVQAAVAASGDAGANIFSTVLFTVLPTLAAIGLYLAARRRKTGKR